jgi:tetratricopeptide (TPR) repeat protein
LNSFNEGVLEPYNQKNYQKAYESFNQSAHVYEYINTTFKTNYVDTLANLYAANAATKLKKYDEALAGYQAILDKGISRPDIYSNMGEIYLGMKDTVKAINVISEGAKKFPSDKTLMVQELNIYCFQKDTMRPSSNSRRP